MSCDAGHTTHATKTITVTLDGQPKILDVPEITPRLNRQFNMDVYDWQQYFKTEFGNQVVPIFKGYCPGQDVVSFALDVQGVWEGYETCAVLDILSEKETNNAVVDMGAHLGYYSLLAGTAGYSGLAYETDPFNLEVLAKNLALNAPKFKIINQWIDEKTPKLPDMDIHLLKCDIEGNEKHAVKMVEKLLRAKRIKYLLLEISPCFNQSYPQLVEKVCGYGYRVYEIPHKSWEHTKEYAEQPLKLLKQYCEIPKAGRRGYVASLHQENFVFIREEA